MRYSFFDCDDNKFVNTIEAARFVVSQIESADDLLNDKKLRMIRDAIVSQLSWLDYRNDILVDVLSRDEAQAIELFDNYKLNIDAIAEAIIDNLSEDELRGIANLRWDHVEQ